MWLTYRGSTDGCFAGFFRGFINEPDVVARTPDRTAISPVSARERPARVAGHRTDYEEDESPESAA